MANPNNTMTTVGRLARDITTKENSNGSHTVYATVMVSDNFKTGGEYKAHAINYQMYVPDTAKSRLDYLQKWGRKGFLVTILGHVSSSSYEKNGETVYVEQHIMDDYDFAQHNAKALKELEAAGSATEPDEDVVF